MSPQFLNAFITNPRAKNRSEKSRDNLFDLNKRRLFMNPKSLDDADLVIETKRLVKKEKEITLEILKYLQEIDLRKIYLARGFSSLFEFCVKELGYSETSANCRIAAMRLMRDLPEVEEKMKENKVNLSTVLQLNSHIRREEKVSVISKEEKLDLLLKIENKT